MFLYRSRGEAGVDRLSRRLGELEILKSQNRSLAGLRQERIPKSEAPKAYDSNDMSNSGHKVKDAEAMKTYRKVRECARSVHSALSKGWHCECATPHHANLRLEARRPSQGQCPERTSNGPGVDEDVRFKFLFSCAEDQGEKGRENGEEEEGGKEKSNSNWREAEIAPFVCDSRSPASKQHSDPARGRDSTPESSSHGDVTARQGAHAVSPGKQ